MNARIGNGMDIKGADITWNYEGYDVVEDRERLNREKEEQFQFSSSLSLFYSCLSHTSVFL